MTTLDELTPWLFSRVSGGVNWGLERTERLLAGAGNPHRLFRSVLIGGTNGKGSVSALCEAALREVGGRRVGLYTSPHLVSFTERIRVDGIPVEAERIAEIAERLRPAIEATGASFFEATTAMAFVAFAEAEVDLAVVEVGLGGRLDSTNVLTPLVTAVTNVAVEHTEYLGETIEQIAFEKAGIFKPGIPAVVGEEAEAPLGVFSRKAAQVGAPFHRVAELARVRGITPDGGGTRVDLVSQAWGEKAPWIPLRGPHQASNAATAVAVLGLLPDEIRPDWSAVEAGFAAARWPGRLQVERRGDTTWVFDVAHNPAGARVLAAALREFDLPRPLTAVVSILRDKEWRSMLPDIAARADRLVLTIPPSAPTGRRWDLAEVLESWRSEFAMPWEDDGKAEAIADLAEALRRAEDISTGGTVLVTGSVHTVGDAMAILGIPAI